MQPYHLYPLKIKASGWVQVQNFIRLTELYYQDFSNPDHIGLTILPYLCSIQIKWHLGQLIPIINRKVSLVHFLQHHLCYNCSALTPGVLCRVQIEKSILTQPTRSVLGLCRNMTLDPNIKGKEDAPKNTIPLKETQGQSYASNKE